MDANQEDTGLNDAGSSPIKQAEEPKRPAADPVPRKHEREPGT